MNLYNCKVVDLGDHLKITKYEKGVNSNFSKSNEKVSGNKNKMDRKKKSQKTRDLRNSEIESLIQLIYFNFRVGDLFVTLTYRECDITLERGSRDFENWIKRLRERYGDFKYIAIRSFQKRGALHYHVLLTIPTLPTNVLKSGNFNWDYGAIHIKRIYSLDVNYKNSPLIQYLVKNLKEFKADERSFGKRLIAKSKNLKKPKVVKGKYEDMINSVKNEYPNLNLITKGGFKTKYLGKVEVAIYKK